MESHSKGTAAMMYSVKQVAEMLQVGVGHVGEWVRRGELDAIDVSLTRTGKKMRLRIPEDALRQFLERRRVNVPPPARRGHLRAECDGQRHPITRRGLGFTALRLEPKRGGTNAEIKHSRRNSGPVLRERRAKGGRDAGAREARVERRPQERGESSEFSLLGSTFSSLLTPALFLAAERPSMDTTGFEPEATCGHRDRNIENANAP